MEDQNEEILSEMTKAVEDSKSAEAAAKALNAEVTKKVNTLQAENKQLSTAKANKLANMKNLTDILSGAVKETN